MDGSRGKVKDVKARHHNKEDRKCWFSKAVRIALTVNVELMTTELQKFTKLETQTGVDSLQRLHAGDYAGTRCTDSSAV